MKFCNRCVRFTAIIICLALYIVFLPGTALAEKNQDDIVILYENDVHCAVEGYSKIAACKDALLKEYEHVGVVSSGDFIQGGSMGVVSTGAFPIRLVNLVGYDAVALGNHEFDYRLPRLLELTAELESPALCCNFRKLDSEESFFPGYTLKSYGEVTIAYVGIITPSTISSSSPTQFKDENGAYLYTFSNDNLNDVVQQTVDEAKSAGADYVIGLSHIGWDEKNVQVQPDIVDLIAATEGIDVVLDGHSHSVIPGMICKNAAGEDVLLSSTGTAFSNIGKLTISEEGFSTQLIPVETIDHTHPDVDAFLKQIEEEFALLSQRVVGISEVDLITHDSEENRLVRTQETNLGNLCSDALRIMTGAQISYVNGGGMRAPVAKGDITVNDLLNLFPFNNQVMVAELSGQCLKDLIELTLHEYPAENGSFPHVSGITFRVNTAMKSSVVIDENESFQCVDGPYRVYDIRVLDQETGQYGPLDLEATYTLASFDYYLKNGGGGMTMLQSANIQGTEFGTDVQMLENYIVEHLNGVIGDEYAQAQGRVVMQEVDVCTVSVYVDDQLILQQTVMEGMDMVLPDLPEKDGYIGKWDHDGTDIQEDLKISAVYTKIPEPEPEPVPSPEEELSEKGNTMPVILLILMAGAVLVLVLSGKRKKV